MDESEQKCWVIEVKDVLSGNWFYCVWLQQAVGELKRFLSELKQRLSDDFIQEWKVTIRDKDSYFPWNLYLNLNDTVQSLKYSALVRLCKLGLSVLPVNNNFLRYSVCARNSNCVFL